MSYTPLYIKAMETGLVQSRQNFILPADAYPTLENAFVWRERIKRKQGYKLLGRLRRKYSVASIGNSGASPWTFTIYSTVVPPISLVTEPNAQIEPGSVVIVMGGVTFTDQGDGTLTSITPGNSGVINYISSVVTLITTVGAGTAATITFNYFPGLPVMGLRINELTGINNQTTIAFDTKYAYIYASGWQEWIPGTTWTGSNSDFFWSTNYWVSNTNNKIFWATNDSGTSGDPIRYTDGSAWVNFAPQIDAAGNLLNQALAFLPFRGRLLAFNTLEGPNLAGSTSFSNRIRWSAIGNPFTTVSGIVTVVNANAWRDDIRGQGGFLDIPTSQDIIAVGFVRDNLVIYTEESTWQLRYTGRSIAPFQIERVNSELGSESTFSAVQFDTSLVGVGDKGIVECDSFKSDRIDIKIPDLVFNFNAQNNGKKRIHGIRDFVQRLAFWTYPYVPDSGSATNPAIFPNRRLVYNYENDSWAIFTDSLTTLGTFHPVTGETWANTGDIWEEAEYQWVARPFDFPAVIGGNQQGYTEYLDAQGTNDQSLFITNIVGHGTTSTSLPVQVSSPNHNLQTGNVIQIVGIASTDPFFTNLNNGIFGIVVTNADTFNLFIYDPETYGFNTPALNDSGTYLGGAEIKVRDGFRIVSKKFNFLDQGQNIQIGYLDILMDTTDTGEISINMYLDYNDNSASNTIPQNTIPGSVGPTLSDTFFNEIIQTSASVLGVANSTKTWQRVFCATRAAFLTIEYTLSNSQLVSVAQENNVQIDAQILWQRPGGRLGSASF